MKRTQVNNRHWRLLWIWKLFIKVKKVTFTLQIHTKKMLQQCTWFWANASAKYKYSFFWSEVHVPKQFCITPQKTQIGNKSLKWLLQIYEPYLYSFHFNSIIILSVCFAVRNIFLWWHRMLTYITILLNPFKKKLQFKKDTVTRINFW